LASAITQSVLRAKEGGRLWLWLHHHRTAHWVLERGTAWVTIGD
jgi:mannose-6-phosphate isomerase-like protein (cupin superfamily)